MVKNLLSGEIFKEEFIDIFHTNLEQIAFCKDIYALSREVNKNTFGIGKGVNNCVPHLCPILRVPLAKVSPFPQRGSPFLHAPSLPQRGMGLGQQKGSLTFSGASKRQSVMEHDWERKKSEHSNRKITRKGKKNNSSKTIDLTIKIGDYVNSGDKIAFFKKPLFFSKKGRKQSFCPMPHRRWSCPLLFPRKGLTFGEGHGASTLRAPYPLPLAPCPYLPHALRARGTATEGGPLRLRLWNAMSCHAMPCHAPKGQEGARRGKKGQEGAKRGKKGQSMQGEWGMGLGQREGTQRARQGRGTQGVRKMATFGEGITSSVVRSCKYTNHKNVKGLRKLLHREKRATISLKPLLRKGEPTQKIPLILSASGKIIKISKKQITLQKTQPVLFYSDASLHVKNGDWIKKGAPILTLTHQTLVTGDIVQGIPKIEQLFEAINSPTPALKETHNLHQTLHTQVRDIFRKNWLENVLPVAVRQSLSAIQQILVESIQKVYLSQGVLIADKHIEIIVRQMTSKVEVLDSGTTGFMIEEIVNVRQIENANLTTPGKKALYAPAVVGLTQAALSSDSFISAASFQETTRVLSRDAAIGKSDFLRGLKEKVVIGDLISAGTGLEIYFIYSLLPRKILETRHQ